MQYRAIPCNTMQYHAIPCTTMQHNAIPCIINNWWRSVPLPCGQYKAIFNTISILINITIWGQGQPIDRKPAGLSEIQLGLLYCAAVALIVQYIETFQNKIRTSNKIWANRASLYFMQAVSIVEEQLNCDLIFVYFNLRWFCLFKAGVVYLLQFSAQGSSGRVPSNFRFLCGRGNWIVCWSSGGRRVSRVSRVKQRRAKITEYWYS